MPSSTTFVFIVSQFSAVLGVSQDYGKKSFASMGVKKIFWNQIAKKRKIPPKWHIHQNFSRKKFYLTF